MSRWGSRRRGEAAPKRRPDRKAARRKRPQHELGAFASVDYTDITDHRRIDDSLLHHVLWPRAKRTQ